MFAGSNTDNGVYFGSTGLFGRKNGSTTFYINNAGEAVFGGQLVVGGSPGISGTNMTGNGAIINPAGTFAIGNSTTNVTFNGTILKLNGNVVAAENMLGGATLPGYVRTFKGSGNPRINVGVLSENSAWGPITMDATAINNTLGATDYDAYRTLFPAGNYYYELSVPVKNNTSGTNDATYTALVANPPGGSQGVIIDYDEFDYPIFSGSYTVISTSGANVVGDWQTATIFGVGRFTLTSPTYISPAVMTTAYNNMTLNSKSGFCLLIWRVWKA